MRSRSFFIVLVFRLEGDIEDKIGRFFIWSLSAIQIILLLVIRLAGVIEDTTRIVYRLFCFKTPGS
jgi:hypothetical protein